MSSVRISAVTANDLRYEDEADDFFVVQRETIELLRWVSLERVVFKSCSDHPRFFELIYRSPLTEYQETEGFEKPVKCREVFPREKTVTVYE